MGEVPRRTRWGAAMSGTNVKNTAKRIADAIIDNFEISETPNCFWVKTKPGSSFPNLQVPLKGLKFSCWIKGYACEDLGEQIDNQIVELSCEYVIGRSVGSWCQSNDVTLAIEEHAVVDVIVSWFDDWCRRQEERDLGTVYTGRFGSFFDELLSLIHI